MKVVGSTPIRSTFIAPWCKGSTHDFGSCDTCSSHVGVAYALMAELVDVLVLETSAARRVNSSFTEGTIKCVGGQVLKSLGRNPKERELKSPRCSKRFLSKCGHCAGLKNQRTWFDPMRNHCHIF